MTTTGRVASKTGARHRRVFVRPLPLHPASRIVQTLLLALAIGLAAGQQATPQVEGSTRLEPRTFDIARQLRCPVCVSESVAESNSPTSLEMRRIIQEQLEQGRSEAEILAYFQERYGDWILLEPPKRGLHLLVWLLPMVAAVTGLIVLGLFVRRWTRASREPIEVDDNDLARVRNALAEGE